MIYIVYGPQGCGKTRNKNYLQRYLNTFRTFDDPTSVEEIEKIKKAGMRGGVLVLTNARIDKTCFGKVPCRIMSYKSIARKAGVGAMQ